MTNEIIENAKKLRREYNKKYRDSNKDAINQRQKEWRNANKDKVKEYNTNYWIKKANQLKEQVSN